jgi:hypothetical protein
MRGRIAHVARTNSDKRHHNTLVLGTHIEIVDEIGIPIRNTPVTVKFSSGREISLVTDDAGKIYPNVPEGESLEIAFEQMHEAAPNDSSRTSSGQHFAANRGGPADGSGSA